MERVTQLFQKFQSQNVGPRLIVIEGLHKEIQSQQAKASKAMSLNTPALQLASAGMVLNDVLALCQMRLSLDHKCHVKLVDGEDDANHYFRVLHAKALAKVPTMHVVDSDDEVHDDIPQAGSCMGGAGTSDWRGNRRGALSEVSNHRETTTLSNGSGNLRTQKQPPSIVDLTRDIDQPVHGVNDTIQHEIIVIDD